MSARCSFSLLERVFMKEALGVHLDLLSKIKTDLKFTGISMGFVSIGATPWSPDGDGVSDGYYDRHDAHVPLVDGKTLHAVLGGSNEIKLTLVNGTKGAELGWISAEAMKKAVDIDHGLLRVNGKSLAFANVPRPLRRMLAAASA